MLDASQSARVLLITSRETKRLIIPKGWPMKGIKDHEAAAIEARQEAGVLGKVSRKPIGAYSYWKRQSDSFDFVTVDVYLLEVDRQLENWREKEQRRSVWLSPNAAADLVDEPELASLVRRLLIGTSTFGGPTD